MNKPVLVAAALLFLGSGCIDRQPSESRATGQEESQAEGRRLQESARTIVRDVDWEAANAFQHINQTLLPTAIRGQLDTVQIPVLLPSDPQLIGVVQVFPNQDFYTATILIGDAIEIYIEGSRLVHLATPVAPRSPANIQGSGSFTITRSEGLVYLSFNVFNVAYLVRIGCADPSNDARCTDDGFITSIAENLSIAGGAP